MHVDDLHRWIGLQIFSETADEDVQTASEEVRVITPDHVEYEFAWQHLVLVHAQQSKYFGFLFRELPFFGGMAQHQVAVIEGEGAEFESFAVADPRCDHECGAGSLRCAG